MASKKEEIFKKYGMDANGQVVPPSGRVAVNGLPSRDNETKEDIFKRYGMDASGAVVEKRQSTPSWNIKTPSAPVTTPEKDETTWWDRIKDTITGGAKSSLGSNMDAMGAAYEATQGQRTTFNKEQREWYAHQLERAETALRMYEEDGDEHMAQVQRAEVEQLREKVKAFDTVIEGQVQQMATTAARDLAADVTNSGAQNIERAKDGLGTVGQIVVDAGASMTQMAGDALARAALGGGGMLPFAMRAFGGGTQQARAEGATIDEQLLYGGAIAAKEVITEKMFNVALPWAKTYGKGSADDMVKSAIDKAVSRFAKTALGKRALGGGLTLAASGVTEGLEEFFGDWLEWQMPRIYDGDTATFTEQLAQAGYDFLVGSVSGLAGGAFDSNVWNYKPETTAADAQAAQDMPKANSPVEIAPLNEASTGKNGVSLSTDEQRQNVLENQKAIDKAQREASMAEQERRNAPPTAKVEGKLTLPDGHKISTYTSDEKGNAFWVTEEGTVKGEAQDSSVVGAANKWGGDIGRVIVEQYDGADEATYAAAADVFVELGIQSVDGEMTWDKAAEITGAFVDEVGLEHANALYSAGVSAARSPAFRQYYHAGLIGNEVGSVSVQGKHWLSEAVRQYAYELGQAHAKDEKRHKYTVSKKAGFDSNGEGAKKLNRETRRVLDRIGKALGVEIRFATAEDQLSDDANGLYDAATGTIIISPNATNPVMVVVAHEVTHRLQDMDFEAYKQYRRFVIGKMEQRTGTMAVTKLRDRYRAFYGSNSFTDLQAMDELAADYTLAMIEDGNLFRELKEDNRSTARKLWSALKNFISRLTGSQPKGYSLYGTTIEELREAEKLWRGMLDGKKQAEEGSVWDAVVGGRYSLKDGENRLENTQQQAYTETTNFEEGVENGRERKETRESFLRRAAGAGYAVYEGTAYAYGFRPVQRQSAQRNARQVQEELRVLGIDAEIIDGPILWNRKGVTVPVIVEQAATVEGRIFISDTATIASRNVAGHEAFHFWKNGANRDVYIETVEDNLLFASESFREYQSTIAKAYLGGEADFTNAAQMAKLREELFAYISGDIHEGVHDVNLRPMFRDLDAVKAAWSELVEANKGGVRHSLKTDSDGRQLSEGQKAYFANSKSVDAQGNLRVMYRGGSSGFTVFDRKKSSYANLYGRGFYFTDSKSHAEQYGGARAFYLNITNPVPTDETTITKEQLLAFLRAVAENEDDYSFENYGYGATPESVVDAIYSGKSDFAMLYDVSQSAIGDMVEAVELFNEINGTDFDGLILDTETVTFRSEQAKLTSNETPTDDPDIRFSLVTEEQARENNKTALEYFGRTYKWSETGYILLDGSRLDFSGKHEGAPGGYRTVDHRDIRDAFGDDYGGNGYSDSLVQFMREGNIRIMPESGGINLSVMPTREQERALDDFISKERGEVVLDIDDDRGNTVASVEYPRGTRASKVLADIRKYFEDGTMPQVSELAQFRYSLKSDAAMGRTLRDMAEAQNATEKAVKAWVADVHRGKKVDVNIDEAERVAQNLISDYRSSADKFEVTGAVLDLFNYLQNGDGNKNMDTDTIKAKANTVADILLSAEMRGRYYEADFVETPNGMEMSDAAQDNEELRKFLRGTKIVFPKEYVSDLGEENWTAFKEGLKGAQARLSDENNRANVDTLYREDMSRMWPQYFPDSITGEAAMMQRIAEVSQRVFARTNRAHSEGEIEAMMQMTASDILDRFFNLPQVGKTYISVRNLREKSTRTVRRLQDQLQVRDSQGSRASIIRKVKALDKKLRDNTEKSHVPDYLRSAVLELCSLFTQNTSVFSKSKLLEIRDAYDDMLQDENMQYVFDEDISDTLKELSKTLDGRRLSELTGEELQWVDDVVSHFTHLVNNANQAFMNDKRVAVADMANKVISKAVTDKKRANLPVPKMISSGNIKPYYFFKDIGGQMETLFGSLLDGQSRYGRLMNDAQEFRKSVYAKYNSDKWLDSKEKLEMTTEHGDKIVLDVNEALSILATFKREVTNREQDAGHLTRGGIVYEDEMKREIDNNKKLSVKALINKVLQKPDAKAKPLSMGDVLEVSKWLRQNVSEQAEDFVDEMVSYLSIDMAELGNETSMKLTGIRKYNERYYFPYKVSSVYLASKLRDPKESPALRRPGFSKRTQRKANNPIVLRGFTDVWSEHVSEMLTYATMAVPQDTLLRVLNYNDTLVDVEDDTNIYKNVKVALENTYGKRAVEYIEQLLRDMNGGVAIDEREKAASQLVRIYKKNAVGLSVSVAIQQPSSAARAMAEVDTKYFFNVSHKGDYEQLKKYSGVAVIKEMGGFDTNLGRGGATWLKGEDSIIEQAIGFLPQKMDQFTWAYLWNVVKAETRDKHPDLLDNGKETEAFLYAAGRRFDEVVEKTQVYDSVLTRSENMRSKSGLGLGSLFLSFMSEPMVTLNMAVDAVRSKDGKRMARVGGSLLVSIVLNNMLKALWTAGRDDEEEKTYLEKLLYRFNNYMSSDLKPWSYIPLVKYIDDIQKGYGTSIDLLEPWTDLFEKYNKAAEKTQDFGVQGVFSEETMDFLLAIPSLFGVPLDNVKRDVETIINLCSKMAPIDEATKRDLLNAFREGWGADSSLKETLRDGWRNKDNERKRKNALADIEAAYQDKVRGYQKKGKTLKEAQQSAKSSIQSSCTNYLKPIYQSLTGAKKNEVKQFALRISVGGKQLYADYDFSKWDE